MDKKQDQNLEPKQTKDFRGVYAALAYFFIGALMLQDIDSLKGVAFAFLFLPLGLELFATLGPGKEMSALWVLRVLVYGLSFLVAGGLYIVQIQECCMLL